MGDGGFEDRFEGRESTRIEEGVEGWLGPSFRKFSVLLLLLYFSSLGLVVFFWSAGHAWSAWSVRHA